MLSPQVLILVYPILFCFMHVIIKLHIKLIQCGPIHEIIGRLSLRHPLQIVFETQGDVRGSGNAGNVCCDEDFRVGPKAMARGKRLFVKHVENRFPQPPLFQSLGQGLLGYDVASADVDQGRTIVCNCLIVCKRENISWLDYKPVQSFKLSSFRMPVVSWVLGSTEQM